MANRMDLISVAIIILHIDLTALDRQCQLCDEEAESSDRLWLHRPALMLAQHKCELGANLLMTPTQA